MSTGADALGAMRTMLAQGLGTPLFIDDVPNHLHRLAEQMDGAARLSDALAAAPGMADQAARADTMRHAAMMVRALGLNVRQGLSELADQHALQAELNAERWPTLPLPFDDDDCPPHGLDRPGGAA